MKARKPVAATLMPAETPIPSPTLQPMQMSISDSAITQVLTLKRGLYSIHVASAATLSQGADQPFVRVSVPPCIGGELNNVVLGVVGSTQQTMPASGGVAITDVRSSRGTLVISSHGFSRTPQPVLDITIKSILLPVRSSADHPSSQPAATPIQSGMSLIIGLRIERLGLRHFVNGGWAGSRGRYLGISELTLRTTDPDAGLSFATAGFTSAARADAPAPGDPAHASGINKTPLAGFGVRIAPPHDHEFTVVYMGAFAKAGIIGPASDGTPCRSPVADDALVAVDIWLRARRSVAVSRTTEAVPD